MPVPPRLAIDRDASAYLATCKFRSVQFKSSQVTCIHSMMQHSFDMLVYVVMDACVMCRCPLPGFLTWEHDTFDKHIVCCTATSCCKPNMFHACTRGMKHPPFRCRHIPYPCQKSRAFRYTNEGVYVSIPYLFTYIHVQYYMCVCSGAVQ